MSDKSYNFGYSDGFYAGEQEGYSKAMDEAEIAYTDKMELILYDLDVDHKKAEQEQAEAHEYAMDTLRNSYQELLTNTLLEVQSLKQTIYELRKGHETITRINAKDSR